MILLEVFEASNYTPAEFFDRPHDEQRGWWKAVIERNKREQHEINDAARSIRG